MFIKLGKFGKSWNTFTIRFDGRINLESDPDAFFAKFKGLFEFCNDPARARRGTNAVTVEIDLTRADFIYPSALIFLIGLKQSIGESASVKLLISQNSNIHEYLCNCGFADLFEIPPIPDGFHPEVEKGEVIKLQIGERITDFETAARQFVEMVDAKRAMETPFHYRSIESVSEILKNVNNHSASTAYYMIGQGYGQSKRVRFAIYDNGVGIKWHMTRRPYRKQHALFREHVSEATFRRMRNEPANIAIETAAIYEVSATRYVENSGAGLAFLITEFSRPFDGIVSILSQNGFVQWANGEKKLSIELPIEIKGTLVAITAKGLT